MPFFLKMLQGIGLLGIGIITSMVITYLFTDVSGITYWRYVKNVFVAIGTIALIYIGFNL